MYLSVSFFSSVMFSWAREAELAAGRPVLGRQLEQLLQPVAQPGRRGASGAGSGLRRSLQILKVPSFTVCFVSGQRRPEMLLHPQPWLPLQILKGFVSLLFNLFLNTAMTVHAGY